MRVLQILDGKTFSGISKIMLDLSKNISDIDIDLLSQMPIFYDKENRAYNLNVERKNLISKIKYNHRLFKFLKKNKYDIVHINSGVFLYSFQVAFISKLAGVKKIIVHSHSAPNYSIFKKIVNSLFRPLFNKIVNVKLSCSKDAAISLFKSDKNVIIIKNGIEINSFKYNEEIRKKYRKELNIDNKTVYGFTGRLTYQKNPEFLIDLFNKLQTSNSVLLVVGTGELEDRIKEKVNELNLNDKVKFLGFRTDINNLLNCMDIFLFPSVFEGLGISVIEAQTNGLPCFVSKYIPQEANISDNFYRINSFDIDEWISNINKINLKDRTTAYKDTIKSGYDIKDCSKELEKVYRSML